MRSRRTPTATRSRRALLALVFVVGLAAAGCTDDGGDGAAGTAGATATPDIDLAAAQRATAATTTMRVTYGVEVAGMGGSAGQSIAIGGEGVFDVADQRGRMVTDLGTLLGPLGGELEQVFADGVVYLRLPGTLGAMLGSPTEWVRLDYEELAGAEVPEGLAGLDQGDPTSALRWLEGAGEHRVLGTEVVDGVTTTHLEVVIDLGDLPDETPADQALRDQLAGSGLDSVPFEVWVGDDDLIRRVAVSIDSPDGEGTIRTTSEFSDFGVAVDVEIPPVDQTTDARDLQMPTGPPGLGGTPTTAARA